MLSKLKRYNPEISNFGAHGFVDALSWMYGNEPKIKIKPKTNKEKLIEAKNKIQKILKEYDCDIRPIDNHTIGLVNEEFVVNQVIENWESL